MRAPQAPRVNSSHQCSTVFIGVHQSVSLFGCGSVALGLSVATNPPYIGNDYDDPSNTAQNTAFRLS